MRAKGIKIRHIVLFNPRGKFAVNNVPPVHELLESAVSRYGKEEIANIFNVTLRTINRWEGGNVPHPGMLQHALRNLLMKSPDTKNENKPDFTFIDLFAGIGGTRLGFESQGGQCVFTSEYNKFSVETYRANFTPTHEVVGDIRNITDHEKEIPDHDVLLAGFPCQPFSIAGVSKKNSLGREHGFKCATQGTLFFDIEQIIAAKRPAAFLLENVKNLLTHDKKNTFSVIRHTLEEKLGYKIYPLIVDANGFVPQHRERIYIVGFREDTAFSWDAFGYPEKNSMSLGDILHPEDGSEKIEKDYTQGTNASVNSKYTLSPKLWKYLKDYADKHKKKGNGFGYGLAKPENVTRTLSARYYKDGSEILVYRGQRKRPRRLTPRECARLMGYPESFHIPVSDTQAYQQFGNSVVVPVIEEIARIMAPSVIELKNTEAAKQYRMAV